MEYIRIVRARDRKRADLVRIVQKLNSADYFLLERLAAGRGLDDLVSETGIKRIDLHRRLIRLRASFLVGSDAELGRLWLKLKEYIV